MPLQNQLEALLFFKAEPFSIKELAKILGRKPEDIEGALNELERALSERGVRLMRREDEVEIRTAPQASSLIEAFVKEELSKDLGKAGQETLSIVLYQGPLSKREIEYIRGVNSNFILRNLLMRGLIEKVTSPTDSRAFLYKPTTELLSHLGVARIEDLPDYEKVREDIATFKKTSEERAPSDAVAEEEPDM